MNRFEKQNNKETKVSKPLEFTELSDTPLETLEKKMEDEAALIKKFAKEKFNNCESDNINSAEIGELRDQIIKIINSLNSKFSKTDREKLKKSGKFDKSNYIVVLDTEPVAATFGWEWTHSYSEELISGFAMVG